MRNYKYIKLWNHIDGQEWNDWKWQLNNSISTIEQLSEIIKLDNRNVEELTECIQKFKMSITPYYATLFDTFDRDCPIRRQGIPDLQELNLNFCSINSDNYDFTDSLSENRYSPTKNLIHRYPDRVLLLATYKCSMYCRFCTRRRIVSQEDYNITEEVLEKALQYIHDNKTIRDVLISGGDPLILEDSFLEYILLKLRAIKHVEVVRIGTRIPVVLPMRITDSLVNILSKYHPLWVNIHFNHPNEITDLSIKACEKLINSGIPVGNQSVLLRGINDKAEILKELFLKLVKIRVRPYYLYQCDLGYGIEHFRTPFKKGIDIMEELIGHISGFAIPTYVIDAPGGGGKIPLLPNYIVENNSNKIVVRNYQNKAFSYPNVIVDD